MSARQPLVILGAGGHGREALDIAIAMNEVAPTFDILGFLDDGREPGSMAAPHEVPVLGGIDMLEDLDAAFMPAIGATEVRRRLVDRFSDHEAASLVHPLASFGSHSTYGAGLMMAAGVRVTHGTTLGDHVHVDVNATISHDCRIGNFVTVTPGVHLSGGVTIGDGAWVGIGSSVIQGVTVGHDALIGAGAAVVADLPACWTAVGVPAQPIKLREGLT